MSIISQEDLQRVMDLLNKQGQTLKEICSKLEQIAQQQPGTTPLIGLVLKLAEARDLHHVLRMMELAMQSARLLPDSLRNQQVAHIIRETEAVLLDVLHPLQLPPGD